MRSDIEMGRNASHINTTALITSEAGKLMGGDKRTCQSSLRYSATGLGAGGYQGLIPDAHTDSRILTIV